MDITEWDNGEIMQLVMAKGHITQKKLLAVLRDKNYAEIPQSTFACKIRRNTLKLAEFQKICKALGYKIHIKPVEKQL